MGAIGMKVPALLSFIFRDCRWLTKTQEILTTFPEFSTEDHRSAVLGRPVQNWELLRLTGCVSASKVCESKPTIA